MTSACVLLSMVRVSCSIESSERSESASEYMSTCVELFVIVLGRTGDVCSNADQEAERCGPLCEGGTVKRLLECALTISSIDKTGSCATVCGRARPNATEEAACVLDTGVGSSHPELLDLRLLTWTVANEHRPAFGWWRLL